MYKVFVNNRPLILANTADEHAYARFRNEKFQSKKQLDSLLQEFEENSAEIGMVITHYDVDELFYYLRRICKYVAAAGGVVSNPQGEYLLIFRKGKWDLPKGKLDGAETPEEGALREVQEECGIPELTLTESLMATYHTYRVGNKRYLKKTFWFGMRSSYAGMLTPQEEEDITDVRWLALPELEAIQRNTYRSIGEVMDRAIFHRIPE